MLPWNWLPGNGVYGQAAGAWGQPNALPLGQFGVLDPYSALLVLQQQASMANMIQSAFNRVYQMNENTAQQMFDTTMRVGQGWINAFSGRDPMTGLPNHWPW